MNIKETCDLLGVEVPEKIYVNPLRLAIDHEFGRKNVFGKKDYRNRAIDRCIKREVSFNSEFNTIPDLMEKLIEMKCPQCGKKMKNSREGGGSATSYSMSWKCKTCAVKVHLTTPCDGISVNFEDDKGE